MRYLSAVDDPNWIDPTGAVIWAVILFTILLIITLVSLRRGKIKRDRLEFEARQVARREAAISQLNGRDEDFTARLKTTRQHNQETHARHR